MHGDARMIANERERGIQNGGFLSFKTRYCAAARLGVEKLSEREKRETWREREERMGHS
jgi:hypothetical protein